MATERKVVVVTGASQGLGEAFVKAYRERGWRAVGNSRSIAPSSDPDYVTVAGDVGEPEIARKVVWNALERFGRVDTLINNAGIWRPGPIEGISEDLYRRVMSTNLDSVFFATQAAVPAMKGQGGGHIVQITFETKDRGGQSTREFPAPQSTRCASRARAGDRRPLSDADSPSVQPRAPTPQNDASSGFQVEALAPKR